MWRDVALAGLAGVLLAALSGLGGIAAAIGGWLAQPAFAVALARGTQARAIDWRSELPALAGLWGIGVLGAGVVLAWPMLAARQSGSLWSALALATIAGLCLLAVWRTWPVWAALPREGGALRAHWSGLERHDLAAWRGLLVAMLVAVAIGGCLLLAWPGLLAPQARWIVAGAYVVALPLVHWALHRVRVGAVALADVAVDEEPIEDESVEGDDADPADADPAELTAALYDAARGGRVDRALSLLEAGADPGALPPTDARDQRSLPVLAAVLPDLRLLRALIARRVDVNAAHAGMTPLLAATRDSWHGRPEAVMTLLANGADPRAADTEGNTALHHAARSSDPGVAALLRDASAELDVANAEGVTPLGMACAVGNWRLARFLLERGAKPEAAGTVPALLPAAGTEEDDAAGVQLLLKHKARVDARDAQGRSALHEAALAGHADIVAALLAAGADVHARDEHERTPWLDAARGGRLAVLERLLTVKPRLDAVDADGRNALAVAVTADAPSLPLVQRLLDLGIEPRATDRKATRPWSSRPRRGAGHSSLHWTRPIRCRSPSPTRLPKPARHNPIADPRACCATACGPVASRTSMRWPRCWRPTSSASCCSRTMPRRRRCGWSGCSRTAPIPSGAMRRATLHCTRCCRVDPRRSLRCWRCCGVACHRPGAAASRAGSPPALPGTRQRAGTRHSPSSCSTVARIPGRRRRPAIRHLHCRCAWAGCD